MSGIYIHIPFCTQACHYCDFHFSTSLQTKNKILEAMVKEINHRKEELKTDFKSLYIGGGTPSVLDKIDLEIILGALNNYVSFKTIEELTIEINPEDITQSKLEVYKDLGFNRISIGVQSMEDKFLKWMNRAHNRDQTIKAIQTANKLGFNNFSVDFIYGLPTHLNRDYKKELKELIEFNPSHISCYHLTIEQGTYFGHLKMKNKWKGIEEDKSEEEFLWISKTLRSLNYSHYELSNFCKKGHKSLHNSSYWNQQPYVGIGPSAHSFSIKKRRWNVSNNNQYIESLNIDKPYFEEETLSITDIFNERIMLGLRTENGLDKDFLVQNLSKKQLKVFENKSKSLIKDGLLTQENNKLKVPIKKWLLSEYVSREFFILNE